MSATIHYRKTAKADPYLKQVGAPSSFIESLKRAFGGFPVELTESSIPILRGMQAVAGFPPNDDAYGEVIELIEKFGSIELYASY